MKNMLNKIFKCLSEGKHKTLQQKSDVNKKIVQNKGLARTLKVFNEIWLAVKIKNLQNYP